MKLLAVTVVAMALLFPPLLSLATTGSIDATSKYAWGSNIGWVNFNPTTGNVQVTDTALTGYAWSENYGWINFAPANGGVHNDGTGVLSGYAWGEGTGYINFAGISINASGVFTGTATGDIVGSLTFDCANCHVVTGWRPTSAAVPTPTVSVPGAYPLPSFTVNGGSTSTASAMVRLSLSIPPTVALLSVTNQNSSGSSTATSSLQSVLPWNLCAGLAACTSGVYSVTIRFLNGGNAVLGTMSHSITYVTAAAGLDVATTTVSTFTAPPDSLSKLAALQEQLAALQTQLQVLLRTTATSTASVVFGRDLQFGMTGNDVKELQIYLITQNIGPAARALKAHGTTRTFAVLTQRALIEYQKAVSLPATGYFGPLTRAKVNTPVAKQ